MTLYLKDCTYLNWESLEITQSNLAVAEGSREGISFHASVPRAEDLGPEDRVLNCAGKLVTRSFGCGHHHIYSTLARGMPAPRKSPSNFPEILQYVWWHLDKRLDLEMIEASALASAIYCAKSGVTFVIDHHASKGAAKATWNPVATTRSVNADGRTYARSVGHLTRRMTPRIPASFGG